MRSFILKSFLTIQTFVALLLVYIFLISNSCSKTNSEKVVLQVGDIEVNEYIYNRNLTRFEDNYKRIYNAKAPEDSIKKWHEKFVEDLFFAMAAKEINIDTTEEYIYKLNLAQKRQVSKLNGLYWEKQMKLKTIPGKRDIEECYNNRDKLYYFKLINLSAENELRNYFNNDTIIKSQKEFNTKYTELSNEDPRLAANLVLQYPFARFPMLKDTLNKMPVGKPIGPIRLHTFIFYFLINDIEEIELRSLSNEQELLIQELAQVKAYELWNNLNQEIRDQAKAVINDTSEIIDIVNNFESIKKSIENYENKGNKIIAAYLSDGTIHNILVKDIIYFIDENPMISHPKSVQNVLSFIDELIFNDIVYSKSQQIGLLEDKEFYQQKKDYSIRLMTALYKKFNFYNQLVISEEEILEYYNSHSNMLKEATEGSFTILSFSNSEAALNSLGTIRNILIKKNYALLGNTGIFPGLSDYKAGVRIHKEHSRYTQKLTSRLLKLDPDGVYGPVKYGQRFDVIIKEADLGHRMLNLVEASDAIHKILFNRKFYRLLDEELMSLKNRYSYKSSIYK